MSDSTSTHISTRGPRRKRARLGARLPVALPGKFTYRGAKPLLCSWPACEDYASTEISCHANMRDGQHLTALCRLHRHQLDRLSIGEIAVIPWQPRRRKR